MAFIEEKLRTEILGDYDIIVVGAGPAGCGAALGAARAGAKVLLLEHFNALGGAWSQYFMNPLFDSENKGGILREIIDDLKTAGEWGGFWDISFNYEAMKCLLDRKMAEAGVEVLFNTTFAKTLVEGQTVKGVVVENISGRGAYTARYVFDATGDGNVAASAGCRFAIGEKDGFRDCQAMTLMFLVANIPDKYCTREGRFLRGIIDKAYAAHGKVTPFMNPYIINVPGTHFGVVQFTHMYGYDPLSAADVTRATIEGRRQMLEGLGFLRDYDPELRGLELVFSAPALGVRESRRIVGEYVLSADDLYSGRQFPDGLCTVTFNVDIHGGGNAQQLRKVTPYEIPLRALIPAGFDGILTAGRCISGTHEAMASYRVTADCFAMGEAAGCVAARAVQTGIPIREMKVK